MIKNIIFDIGNVLTDFAWKEFLRNKGFDENMIRRIAAASVESPLWNEFDRGDWSEEKLMQAFVDNDPEIEAELHKAYDNVHGIVTPREYAIPWIQQFKERGYRVFYLSNFSLKAYLECQDALTFLPFMDGGILSYQEKVIKPEAAIYELLLSRFGLVPEECVFLDDSALNIEAARQKGIYGIIFETKEQAEEELGRLLSY